ncbi:general transcription factor 3C polypeptide 1 isoform X2 [Amia ocellicauda]|uniref:general transcription factor 3C polypeptide 1 isoform X2 n=1 Tax=Amia ocellicauda TaxID=2972642 RepID=UPI003463B9E3
MDALQMLEDEVALEGLDGITIPALWLRLETRVPKFPLRLDAASRQFLWQSLVSSPDIELFVLPQPRPPLVLLDRFKEIDPETGIQEIRETVSTVEDIYPVHIVLDNKVGIKGSCQFFKERVNVTSQVRSRDLQPLCSLAEALERWEQKLVLVASQTVRYRALLSWEGDPDLKLPDYSYCILERLGRARWQGELQRDLHCKTFKTDAGKLHYLRKVLDRNGLVTLQPHVIRLPSGSQQHSVLLLLRRFHVDRRSKYDILMERVSNILAGKPERMATMLKLRQQVGLSERTFKRMYQYMIAAGLAQVVSVPLQELNPEGGPHKTKKGTDIMVRCLKLLKEYKKKVDEEDDDNDDEDRARKSGQLDTRVVERDVLAQAYEIIESTATKGISQSEIRRLMNVGKLEGRMICRLLERYHMVKGFMEDEGRQRTTKYISKIFVEQSNLNQQFEKEKARSEQLGTGGGTEVRVVEMLQEVGEEDKALSEEHVSPVLSEEEEEQEEKGGRRASARKKTSKKKVLKVDTRTLLRTSKLSSAVQHSTPNKKASTPALRLVAPEASDVSLDKEDPCRPPEESDRSPDMSDRTATPSSNAQSVEEEASVTVVEEVQVPPSKDTGATPKKTRSRSVSRQDRPHETYRLLKRRNLIIEAVRSLKLIESLYMLQKMILDEEKQDGVATRCCKKSILRLVRRLSQEGFLKLFCTTVIQDGVSKKVEFVVHPSILPDDPLVKSAIDQIRFRISSSYTAHRVKVQAEPGQAGVAGGGEEPQRQGAGASKEPGKGDVVGQSPSKAQSSKTDEKMGVTQLKNFHPTIVPGLGRSLGFQPKMPRLRLVHMFLWHVIYGHPSRKLPGSGTRAAKGQEVLRRGTAANRSHSLPAKANREAPAPDSGASETPGTAHAEGDVEIGAGTEVDPVLIDETVYVNELSWKRFVPATPVHREYGLGWALASDILLCLPLSIFVQIIQVSYKVDGLEDYLNDPLKQHFLIRFLPGKMKKQLLYKRRYIFSFYENMQRLCFMGLLQFGPMEKFQDKDQVFIFLKKKATIVDTTPCEPHYNLVTGSRPFERRFYTLDTSQDIENFWFDLQCVCLNTPLGVVRCPRIRKGSSQEGQPDQEDPEAALEELPAEKPTVREPSRLLEYARGRKEVTDDGVIPGDGQGAAGMDSTFFGHLKRNWIWTSYLLNAKRPGSSLEGNPMLRLKTFLTKMPLPFMSENRKMHMISEPRLPGALKEFDVLVEQEPGGECRNARVVGGKRQKRKRGKKGVEKKAKKKKREARVETKHVRPPRFHDVADQNALQRMTRQRVSWSAQEDGFLMLCRVASHFLNRKIKRPFVPWQVVRDLLHAQFEESLDKTSLSVGRRARYIMKNPQTSLNFKICLAEVYQDKPLVGEFLNRENDYENPEVCSAEFKEFVAVLRQKFSTSTGYLGLKIPDTKEELFRRFKVYAIGDQEEVEQNEPDMLARHEDIHSLVLNNLIQSTLALSNAQMKSCRSFQTFHLYSRYDDGILYEAFLRCQKRGLVNRRRISKVSEPKKSRALPFLPMSYQLSQAYYRCFTWRFPSTLCTEAHQFLETLRAAGRQDRPNTFVFQDQAEAPPDPGMVLFCLDAPGGCCLASLSLLILGLLSVDVSIPEQIVVVDSTMVDNEVVKSMGKEVADEDDDEEAEEGEGKRKIEVKARQASHTNYLLMKGYCSPGIVSLRNLNTNDNIVVNSCQMRVRLRSSPAHRWFSTAEPYVADDPAWGETCLPPGFTRLVRMSSDDSGRLQRFSAWCIDRCGYSAEDLQAVLELSGVVEEARCFGCDRRQLRDRFAALEEVAGGRTRTLWQYLQDLVDLEEVVEVGGNTVRLVAMKFLDPWLLHTTKRCGPRAGSDSQAQPTSRKRKVQEDPEEDAAPPRKMVAVDMDGAAAGDDVSEEPGEEKSLETSPGGSRAGDSPVLGGSSDPDPTQAAAEAQSTGPVDEDEGGAREGGAEEDSPEGDAAPSIEDQPTPADAVPGGEAGADEDCTSFPQTTAAQSVEDSSELERVSFISRPWRIVDGSLNQPVCKGMLEALLFHIMTRPGVPQPVLLRHYSGVLQPVVVLELLQALEEMGCIQRRSISPTPRPSLFSRPGPAQLREGPPQPVTSDCVFYEPALDCCLRLGRVFPRQPNWNKWVQYIHT